MLWNLDLCDILITLIRVVMHSVLLTVLCVYIDVKEIKIKYIADSKSPQEFMLKYFMSCRYKINSILYCFTLIKCFTNCGNLQYVTEMGLHVRIYQV